MKYTTVNYECKVSDGNYGSKGYSVGAVVEEGDDVKSVMIEVTNMVHSALGLDPVANVASKATTETPEKPAKETKAKADKPAKAKPVKETKAETKEEPKEEKVPAKVIVPYSRDIDNHRKQLSALIVKHILNGKALKDQSDAIKAKAKLASETMDAEEVPMYADGELLEESFVAVLKTFFSEDDL